MTALMFMGVQRETFRCRVYGDDETEDDRKRQRFIERLAGEGVIDCPAFDPWVRALQERGWLPDAPVLEPNPDGPGKIGRWLLTDRGRSEAARMGVL